MNGNSDKHKPLSPEELFRLLETKKEDALPGEDLDDFEREALEGFSTHTSAEKARQLTGEVHQRIHEKLAETEKKRPLARIIWLGAAASVVIGLIITAYSLTQQAKFPEELALNKEVSDELKPAPVSPAAQEPPVAGAEKEKKTESGSQLREKDAVPGMEHSPEKSNAVFAANRTQPDGDMNQTEYREYKALEDLSLEKPKSELKEGSATGQGQPLATYNTRLAATQEQEDRKVGYISSETVAANKAAAPKADVTNTVPVEKKVQKESSEMNDESAQKVSQATAKLSLRKGKKVAEDTDKDAVTTATGSTKTEEPIGGMQKVFYTGGEQGLKAGVAAWLKERRYGAPKGDYTIRMKIKTDGTAEALEVKSEKAGGEQTAKLLQECLTDINGWIPADSGEGARVATFTLSF